MKWLARAALVVTVGASLAACWSWSFPDELLNADGGASDATLDTQAAAGGSSAGGSGGAVGGSPAGGRGGANGCTPISCTSTATPVCDAAARVCRPCRKDAECASGVCAVDGHCATDDQIVFVASTCGAVPTGARATPFCRIADALLTPKPYVLVNGGTHKDIHLSTPRELHGTPGTVIDASMHCDGLLVDGPGAIVVGFKLAAGVLVKGKDAVLKLTDSQVGASTCVGVTASMGATLTLERNFIYQNEDGGVWADDSTLQMRNNIVAANGTVRGSGGVRLSLRQPSVVANNTIVANTSRGNMLEAPGVRCDSPTALINNIVWGNTRSQGVGQMTSQCMSSFGIVQLTSSDTVASNIDKDPLFVGGLPQVPASYRLTADSPAVNAGSNMDAPPLDFDAQPRDANPDIGAFERL